MATDIFGIDLGGMSAGIIHQDRLVMVGSGAVPDMLVASRTGRWTDFALGYTAPDQDGNTEPVVLPGPGAEPVDSPSNGFWFQQTTGRGNAFHALLQQEGLFVFGNVGESNIPVGRFVEDEVEIRENSWYGSDLGRTPIIAGGLALFLQKGAQDIRGFAWTEAERKYIASPLMAHAGQVFSRAIDMTFQTSTERHGDTVFIIDEDGSMATLLLRVGSQYPAFANWTVSQEGEVSDRVVGGTAPLGIAAFLVERNDVIAVETFNDREWLDGALSFTITPDRRMVDAAGNSVSLPGWMLTPGRILAWRNGVEPERELVIGEMPPTFPLDEWEAMNEITIGAPFECRVETLPFVANAATGLKRSIRKTKILDVALDCISEDVDADPESLSSIRDSDNLLQAQLQVVMTNRGQATEGRRKPSSKIPLQAKEGIKTLEWPATRGWRDRVALRFSSKRPLSIAGIAYRAVG